ncbi:MAG: aminotransferase class V-fold PLP-dependent enzyme [Planctomycetota bacterium]
MPAMLGESLRQRYPATGELAFLNHAAVAPISADAAEKLRWYADQASSKAYVDAGWYRQIDRVRGLAAELIGAHDADDPAAYSGDEIAFVPNTSTGLALVAQGLDWRAGDRVVITDVEYPANRYPWEHLARTRGVEMVEVAQRDDRRIHAEDVIAAIDGRTRVVSLSSVQFASGHRIGLRAISDAVRAVDGYLCVDGIQSVGVLPVDVETDRIDFLAADGHKWLLGPEGAGIFYCRRGLTERLTPAVVGWLNMVDAENYLDYRYEFRSDAKRFEPGTWNVPGVLALGASMRLLLDTGIDAVWSSVEALTARACEGLSSKGYRVVTPRDDPGERSGIVVFEKPGAAQAEHRRIANDLEKQGVVIALRGGRLRVSPHAYNTAEDIDRLIDGLPIGGGR